LSTNPTSPAMAMCERCNAFRPVAEVIGELTRPAHAVLRVCGHVVPARAAPRTGCLRPTGAHSARDAFVLARQLTANVLRCTTDCTGDLIRKRRRWLFDGPAVTIHIVKCRLAE
jgi:hypothetical protein